MPMRISNLPKAFINENACMVSPVVMPANIKQTYIKASEYGPGLEVIKLTCPQVANHCALF